MLCGNHTYIVGQKIWQLGTHIFYENEMVPIIGSVPSFSKSFSKKKLSEDFPAGKIKEHEKPDFLVKQRHGCLGIEITELVREKHPNEKYSAAERAGFCDKIVRDARRLCEQWGTAPLLVTIWIIGSMDHVQGSSARKELSENLARFVKQWCDEHTGYEQGFLKPGDALPEIWQIHLWHPKVSLDAHRWMWKPGGVWVGPVHVDSLQSRISEKNESYEEYRKACTECWLLVIGDPCDPSKGADIGLDAVAKTHRYSTKFDRVFFLQLLDELVELERHV